MEKGFGKIAAIAGIVSVLCVGYTALAMAENMNWKVSAVNASGIEDTLQQQEEKTESDKEEETGNGKQQEYEAVTAGGAGTSEKVREETVEEEPDSALREENQVFEENQTAEQSDMPEQADRVENQQNVVVWENNSSISGTSGISYFLNMKRNETLSALYQKMDALLIRELAIYKALEKSGEITYVSVKQIEAAEVQMASQKAVCENEAEYNKFVLSQLNLSFDDVNIKEIKNVGDMESYISKNSVYDTLTVARYVTDCKNAVSNIKAKEAEKEALTAAKEQMLLLKNAGEASELEVINSELTLLRTEVELEAYYYDMNVAYYLVGGE